MTTNETKGCCLCWRERGTIPVDCACPCHTNDSVGGWERELREEIAGNMTSVEATQHLIDFIRSLLAKSRREVVGEIISVIDEKLKANETYDDDYFNGYCAALEAIKQKLLSKEAGVE